MFSDESNLFFPPLTYQRETFPIRIKLKPFTIFQKPIVVKDIVQDLTFIQNKVNWGGQFQGKSIRRIPDGDFQFILNQSK